MKKFTALILAAALTLSLAACSGDNSAEEAEPTSEPVMETEETMETAESEETTLAESEAATEEDTSVSPSDLGIGPDELEALIPEEDIYDHGLNEDETQEKLDAAAAMAFSTFNSDTYPDLQYVSSCISYMGMILWNSGFSWSSYAAAAMAGNESAVETWESIVKLQDSLSDIVEMTLSLSDGYEDYHCLIALLNDTNMDKMLLVSYNGEIIYDVTGLADQMDSEEETAEEESEAGEEIQETSAADTASTGEKNALSKANSYLRSSAFSYSGLIDQLEYSGFTTEEATYGADNCGADWYEQALLKANSYLRSSSFSYSGLIDQLEYSGFTTEEATYGADNCGADWNEQAAQKAASYLSISSFSRDKLISQLEYSGFTHDQAVYGAEANGY